jgi:hypothetical protein
MLLKSRSGASLPIRLYHRFYCRVETKKTPTRRRVKCWEIIADNLSKAGWSWGCASGMDCCGRTIFIADAHRDDGKRFVVRADEKLTAFMGLESAIRSG